jgi:outer membrane protein TolC
LREVEAAQFEALQSKVIAEASIANAELTQAQQVFIDQQKLLEKQQSNAQRMARKFSVGEIDRLELSFNKLESIAADKNVALAQFQLQTALTQLENVLQKPLSAMKTQTKNNSSIEDLSFKKPAD